MKKICAVMPAHNEEKNIVGVIRGVMKYNIDVVVIDDGSEDNTARLAKASGAVILTHDTRKGKGASLKDGLDWAMASGYDYIITIDSDGQHNPDEIPSFISVANTDHATGVIIGNRLINYGKMPLVRICTNRFMSSLISALCKQQIPDTQCGYKLIKKDVLKNISIKSKKFEIESEILVKAAKVGFKIASIPIKSIYANEKSNINPVIDTLRFIRFLAGIMREK
ncbi:MAG: glycosyltransferase family 2 protein [Candidatus Omnitrophota bacterium]